MEKRRRKKCPYCNRLFWPRANIKNQGTCGKINCQLNRMKRNAKRWRRKYPSFQASHSMDTSYRKDHARWKRKYRKKHSQYVRKNRIYWWKWKLKQSPSYRVNENSQSILEGYTP